ncbi:hypothetical protein ZIOFF_027137 [Zingiber officinale]|uniref:Uncharacterized protein n=1 Tax=Zingiber officinale TaxID=94328 RepID=A0A8J5LGG5_ZINOF|nr:hypothetical protein ZIOFF_027137 [Zingiber officinale]
MELNRYEVEDEMYVEKVLNNFLLKFDYIVAVLQEKMPTEELHGSLILHESRIHERLENSMKKDSTEKVLQALTLKNNEQGQSNNGGGDSHARGRNFRARGRGGCGNYQGCGRAKKILRYIKGTQGDGILYARGEPVELLGYTDSDWAGDIVERKSTSGYAFFIISGVFSWSSKKQPVIVLSTAEAEYIVASNCDTQAHRCHGKVRKHGINRRGEELELARGPGRCLMALLADRGREGSGRV